VTKALQAVFPEQDWKVWQSPNVPKGLWDPKNHRQLFDKFAEELNIKKPEDWYNVTGKQLKQLGCFKLMYLSRSCTYLFIE
jgi:hypothetical protein